MYVGVLAYVLSHHDAIEVSISVMKLLTYTVIRHAHPIVIHPAAIVVPPFFFGDFIYRVLLVWIAYISTCG